MIGSKISHYVIEDRLGAGGMGTVYRGRDSVLGRTVAIKVISPDLVEQPEQRARLLREARAASSLNHPNVVTVYEVGRDGAIDFIAMEHVEGQPLSHVITPGGLAPEVAIDYARQIAAALAVAHRANVVHRDIKPSNIMVLPDGRVKVLDFGLARQLPASAGNDLVTRGVTSALTVPGAIMGTVGYMAPELFNGGPATPRSDVFAVGAVMFEMLTGRPAFEGDSTWAVISSTMKGDVPTVGSIVPGTPPEPERIVARAIASRPEDRYPSASELAADLAGLVTGRVGLDGARPSHPRQFYVVLVGALALAAVGIGLFVWSRVHDARLSWARERAPREIDRLVASEETVGAFELARRALAVAPDDPQLKQSWANVSLEVSLDSHPSGADVSIRSYLTGNTWVPIGRTPLVNVRVPPALLRLRVTKPGYDTLEVGRSIFEYPDVTLTPAGSAPVGMVLVPSGSFQWQDAGRSVDLPNYWLDRHEVTNREFKTFVDRGGYRTQAFWKEPFINEGRTLSWDEAMALLRDTTGRPGPSTWELATFPEGQDDYPVSGVSWYEAAAYAAFADKALPTLYHWYKASGAFSVFSDIVRASNFSGKGPVRVGSTGGVGPYGTDDMAGNVKEWVLNATGKGLRYALGGDWHDATYQFRDVDAQAPFLRRTGFGFRCMRQMTPLTPSLSAAIENPKEKPTAFRAVDDRLYAAYRPLYDYDRAPLNAVVDSTETDNPVWRQELVSIDAAYGRERVPIYLFVPKAATPPYQTVVFFPGSNAVRTRSSRNLWLQFADFVVRSGRVLVYPVYQGTYERRLTGPRGVNTLRDLMIQRAKDTRRTLDYLDSRPDMDHGRVAFYGVSLGAQTGPLLLAVEPRFKTGVFLSGGFERWEVPPEADPVNFAPHVTVPVLMVNGRDDFDLPYETAQLPLFRALGTREPDKRQVLLEGGHIPDRPQEPIKIILDWLDYYLGVVK